MRTPESTWSRQGSARRVGSGTVSLADPVCVERDANQQAGDALCWLFAAYVVLLPLSMLTLESIGSALKAVSVAIVSLGVLVLLRSRTRLRALGGAESLWILYSFYTLLTLFWVAGGDGNAAATGLAQLTALSVLLTRFDLTSKREDVLRVAWLVTGSVCALLITFSGGRIQYVDRAFVMLPGGASDANEFCAYFIMPLAVLASMIVGKGLILSRLLLTAMGTYFFYCVASTGSRGGLLACIIAFVLSLVVTSKKNGIVSLVRVATAVIPVAIGAVTLGSVDLLPQGVRERLSIEALRQDGGSGRDVIWRTSWDLMMTQNERFCVGFGPFGNQATGPTMHNQFLQAFVDGGLIGLTIYVAFCVALLHRSLGRPYLLAAVVGAFVQTFTLTASASFKPIWAIFAFCLLPPRSADAAALESTVARERGLPGLRPERVK